MMPLLLLFAAAALSATFSCPLRACSDAVQVMQYISSLNSLNLYFFDYYFVCFCCFVGWIGFDKTIGILAIRFVLFLISLFFIIHSFIFISFLKNINMISNLFVSFRFVFLFSSILFFCCCANFS